MAEVAKNVSIVCKYTNGRYGKKELERHGIKTDSSLRFKTHTAVVSSAFAEELKKHPQYMQEFGPQGQFKFVISGEPVRVVKPGDEFASDEGRDKAMEKLKTDNAALLKRLEALEAGEKTKK